MLRKVQLRTLIHSKRDKRFLAVCAGLLSSNAASRVTLIAALGNPAAAAVKAATTKIPVVFAVGADPTEIGLVDSLDHPGANMTGVTGMAVRREQKRFELLHAGAPKAPILGLLLDPQNPNQDARANDVFGPAQNIGVQKKLVRASAARDFGNVFTELAQSPAGGLVIADDEFFLSASDLPPWRSATAFPRSSRGLPLPLPAA